LFLPCWTVCTSAMLVCAIPMLAQPVTQSASQSVAQQLQSPITVDRIFTTGEFRAAQLPETHWLKDGKSFIDLKPNGKGSDIVRIDAVSGGKTVLVPASVLSGIDIESMTLSNDEGKALLFHNSQRVWRRHTKGQYAVVDFATKQLTPVSPNTSPKLFAKFSPDGRSVAYVRDNNLYVFDIASGAERQLTTDGGPDVVNGTSDWVYEEEFGVRDGFRWSPDGARIAYWHFNTSTEPVMTIINQTDSLYPSLFQYKYPKAGQPNATVRIGVVRVGDATTQWINTGADSTVYIPRMGWLGSDSVWVERMPRRQNRADLLIGSAATGETRTLLTDTDSAYVDAVEPMWVDHGKQLLWTSDRSGWKQVYLYNRNGSVARQVTKDGYDVLDIAAVDDVHGEVYVKAAAPNPTQAQIYRYALRTGRGGRLTTEAGSYDFSLAPGGRYAAITHSSLNLPPAMTLYALPAMHAVRQLGNNDTLVARLQGAGVTPATFLKIPAADNATMLDAYRIVPPGFDSTKKYPVLIYTYGGPAIPEVNDSWSMTFYLFHQMIAQHGYIIIVADNRGAAWRGHHFRKLTQGHVGVIESDDQIAVAKWIGRQSWGDSARVGIWGWSYGGYNTAMSAFRGGSIFKAAISVAPVSDWRFYDSIYTERFMWVPSENTDGYDSSSALNYVKGLRAKYLLIFGTGDDNVHPQNSMVLAQQLELARKPFVTVFFPNKTHSISGPGGTLPVFDLLQRFILENL
jgi:dipeptidyl-peptidase-4